jgi:glycosyltransferase involved in cell wall biosynthesis
MRVFKNPGWLKKYDFQYDGFHQIPAKLFHEINMNLAKLRSENPLVSVIIPAWNEEVNILKTIASLASTKTIYPLEIIVINNNSTDGTQLTLNHLSIKSYFQHIQGWGPARQMGLEMANGEYVLLADADCIYPACWVDKMVNTLLQDDVVCVYGRYSFISENGYPRWKLFLLEKMKDLAAGLRHLKRPYLNAYGMSMGFVRKYGLKAGFVMHKIRGEDGRMCFDLMQYGKVKQVSSAKARVWTRPRTLKLDGSFANALYKRCKKEVKRLHTFLTPLPMHDTKSSTND